VYGSLAAFSGLRATGPTVHAPAKTLAVVDHNIPTTGRSKPNPDPESIEQMRVMAENAREFGITYYNEHDKRQGIVHVIGPEQGFTLPGTTIVCGDSHTSTHGAFGALAFGIGTSEVEHVLATQCLVQAKPRSMRISYQGSLGYGVTAKDLILATIGQIGVAGAAGHVVEYAGPAIESLSMEGRMTVCNMTIEGGGRAGMIAPDDTTLDWVIGRPGAPTEPPEEWRELHTDPGASFEKEMTVDATAISPMVTWGTNPGMVVPVTEAVPEPDSEQDQRALQYMGLESGIPMQEIKLDRVFIGSCTNSRIGDLRAAAAVLKGQRVSVPTIITPGSQAVRRQAEKEGLHDIFQDAGALWTHSSCGPCLGMSMGVLAAGTRCVSSSNRNFPGRMGDGGRVHLAAPAVVAASAILGRLASPSEVPSRETVTA